MGVRNHNLLIFLSSLDVSLNELPKAPITLSDGNAATDGERSERETFNSNSELAEDRTREDPPGRSTPERA